jgi:hypothetical protein
MEGDRLLASAEQYDLAGVFEARAVRVCGIGSLCGHPSADADRHVRLLVETLLDAAARRGAEMGLLYPQPGVVEDLRHGFQLLPLTDMTLHVADSPRHGAPMTMVRTGEERDLPAVVAMGRSRAERFRFHLDREGDFVQYAITRKRSLAGLAVPGGRQFQFFIAEEGITAAAYVVISVAANVWTVEECGDRDPSGARVGALLQALIAREPVKRRPTIRAWLPARFLPPQVTVESAIRSTETVLIRVLHAKPLLPPLTSDDVLFWRNDRF